VLKTELPEGWEWRELPEFVFYQEGPGVRKWQFRDQGIKLLNVKNIRNGRLNLSSTERHLDPDEVSKKYSHFLLNSDEIVMASSGVTWGKTAFVRSHHLPLLLNTSTIRFRSLNKEKLNDEYLNYFLNSKYFKEQINRLITGSAQPNFGPSHLSKVKLIVPPLDTQRKIVAILEKAEATQRLRAKANNLTDKSIFDIFFNIFGDFDENLNGWDVVKLNGIVREKITDGVHKTPKYIETGIPFISTTNIKKNQLNFLKCKQISFEEHELFTKRCKPEKGDILLSKVGTLGMVAKVNCDDFSIFVQLALIKLTFRTSQNRFNRI